MKVVVTGGAGFIGSHVVVKLLQQQCQVTVIDNLSTGCKENVPKDVKFIEIDICSKKLVEVFVRERFDAVVHLAAQTMVPVSLDRPDYDCQVNIVGTVNVLEACRISGVKRVVFSSSAAVYGDVKCLPIMEDVAKQPTSFYGLSKLTVERYLQMYQQIFGLEYVILRYANVYGERQGDGGEGGVISIFTRKINEGEIVTVYGDGAQSRDFVYAGDVAAANYQALITGNINTIYNISTQVEVSINQLIEVLGKITGKQVEKSYSPVRAGDIYRSALSNQAALGQLGWHADMLLSDGLALTYMWQGMTKR